MYYVVFRGGYFFCASGSLKYLSVLTGIKIGILQKLVNTDKVVKMFTVVAGDKGMIKALEEWDRYMPKLRRAIKNER